MSLQSSSLWLFYQLIEMLTCPIGKVWDSQKHVCMVKTLYFLFAPVFYWQDGEMIPELITAKLKLLFWSKR